MMTIERISDSPEFRASLIQDRQDQTQNIERQTLRAELLQQLAEEAIHKAHVSVQRVSEIDEYLGGTT